MKTLNIAEARQNFSAIVDDVRFGGKSVIVSKYGHPVAMITPLGAPGLAAGAAGAPNPPPRDWRDELGLRNDNFEIPSDFDDPMDDLWKVFDDTAEELAP